MRNLISRCSLGLRPSYQNNVSRYLGSSLTETSGTSYRKHRNVDPALLLTGPFYSFGKGAPKWTISGSRPAPLPQVPLPGPGEYEIPSTLIDKNKIMPQIQFSTTTKPVESITASVGFMDRPSLMNVKSGIVIGKKDLTYYNNRTPGPGPGKYYPTPKLNLSQCHRIASRHDIDRSSEIPGPGHYEISGSICVNKPHNCVSNQPLNRTLWMTNGIEVTPGPTDYTPIPSLSKRVATSFGDRNKKKRKSNISNVLVLGPCFIKFASREQYEAARKAICKNSFIKEIINEIFEQVFEQKPDDPLEFIREYFLPEVQVKDKNANAEEEDEDY